jgi:tRNA(adenine34) deaminase
MHYELFMRSALGEAALAAASGERADGAVAVLDEAMVAHGREGVSGSGDPTAHAVMVCLREAARRLGRAHLTGLTVFVVVEPCAMCAAALRLADADAVVYALADPREGACGSLAGGADEDRTGRRIRIVSGILADEAAELRPDVARSRAPAPGGSAS